MNGTLEGHAMVNGAVTHAGPLAGIAGHVQRHPLAGEVRGKVWLKEALGLTGMEVSLGVMKPGQAMPFLHAHKENEELYLFLSGEGEMLVDGEVVAVREGSAVRCAPAAVRGWRNTGTVDMVYVVVQAREGSLRQWTFTDGVPVKEAPRWT